MIVDACAVISALVAVDFSSGCFACSLATRNTVRRRRISISLGLGLADRGSLGVRLVDIAPNLEVHITLATSCSGSLGLRVRVLLTLENHRVCGWLPWLQATRCIADDLEVASERWANVRRARFGVDLMSQTCQL